MPGIAGEQIRKAPLTGLLDFFSLKEPGINAGPNMVLRNPGMSHTLPSAANRYLYANKQFSIEITGSH